MQLWSWRTTNGAEPDLGCGVGVFEPFLQAVRQPNGRRPTNHRLVLDGLFWVARTGAPWRDLLEEFSKWGSIYRQFRRWTLEHFRIDLCRELRQECAFPDTR